LLAAAAARAFGELPELLLLLRMRCANGLWLRAECDEECECECECVLWW